MKEGHKKSLKLLEIDSVYIVGNIKSPGYYKKEDVYDFLIKNPGTIRSNVEPYPKVIPAKSTKGEKYIKTIANRYDIDNLLSLPRE